MKIKIELANYDLEELEKVEKIIAWLKDNLPTDKATLHVVSMYTPNESKDDNNGSVNTGF